jgi:hypothetical protein
MWDIIKYKVSTIFFLYFCASYFPYDEQNGTRSSKSNDFKFNVLLFCEYLKLV